MSSRLSSLRMRLGSAALAAVLVPAIGLAGRVEAAGPAFSPPLLGGVNYTSPAAVTGTTAAVNALTSSMNSTALNTTAATVASANSGNGPALQAAVTAAFNNPNAAGDTGSLASAFITGFIQGTSSSNLNSSTTGTLVTALFNANVSPTTILTDALTALGGNNPANLTANSQSCNFLQGVLQSPQAATFLQSASALNPDPIAVCFPSNPGQ